MEILKDIKSYSLSDKYMYNIINIKCYYFSYSGSYFPNLYNKGVDLDYLNGFSNTSQLLHFVILGALCITHISFHSSSPLTCPSIKTFFALLLFLIP